MVSSLDHMKVNQQLRYLQCDPAAARVPAAPVEVPPLEALGCCLLVRVLRNELVAVDVLVEALAQLAVRVEAHGCCRFVVWCLVADYW